MPPIVFKFSAVAEISISQAAFYAALVAASRRTPRKSVSAKAVVSAVAVGVRLASSITAARFDAAP